jgi:hypothetical protein
MNKKKKEEEEEEEDAKLLHLLIHPSVFGSA